tara:strand:+ start:639 stop:827 length:189 start_codon:yes stop_codon:yes gene_type:complete
MKGKTIRARVWRHIDRNPGKTRAEIAKALKLKPSQVSTALRGMTESHAGKHYTLSYMWGPFQ